LNAEGKVTNWLRLTASAAAIRALSDEAGTPAFDKQNKCSNVPHPAHGFCFADVLVPHARGLHLNARLGLHGRKEATRDDLVSVSGYNLFNLGAATRPAASRAM